MTKILTTLGRSDNAAAKQKVADAIEHIRNQTGFKFLASLPGHDAIARALREETR